MFIFMKLETVFCRRFFYFYSKLFLSILLLFNSVKADVHNGFIVDQNNDPIPYVYIQNFHLNLMSFSDEEGYFELPGKIAIDDTLLLTRIGYQTQKFIITNPENILIHLQPENVSLRSVIIEGEMSDINTTKNQLVKIEKTAATAAINPRAIYSSIPGAYVKSYGGSAGISTISMDGAPTRHTKILLAGFDITNAQNGQVDLSQLPDNFIDNISYSPNANTVFHQSGNEGAVNISPWQNSNSLFYGIGSYGKEEFGISLSKNIRRLDVNLLAGKSQDKGNYKGYNPISQTDEKRENNHLDRQYISMKLNFILSPKIFGRMLYLYSKQERGVAGQVWAPTPESFRDDYFHMLGMKIGWASKIGAGYYQTTIRSSYDHFFNSPTYGFPYDSEHDVLTLRNKLVQNIHLAENLMNTISIDRNDDQLDSKDTGKHERTSYVLADSFEWKFWKWEFTPGIQYNYAPDLYRNTTWNYSIRYYFDNRFISSTSFDQGYYFHYPSFNDLYWVPGGNPDLKPEKTYKKALNFDFSLHHENDLKLVLFYKKSENLIQWLPSLSFWQPKNVEESIRQGIKLVYNIQFANLPVKGFVNYTYNLSEDKATGKELLYSPKHSGAINLDYSWRKWKLHYQFHFTDDRIARYSWPEDVKIDRTFEQTVGISWEMAVYHGKLSNAFLIENLTNEKYETIKGYPEPGRVLKYRIEYLINNKKE